MGASVAASVAGDNPAPDGAKKGKGKGGGKGPGVIKGAGKPGAKAKAKSGMKKCKACKKWFDTSLSKKPSSFCPDDDKALDRIYLMAKSNGSEDVKWLSEVRKDEDKVSNLLDNYWSAVGGKAKWTARSSSATKFNLKEYREHITARTSVERRRQGRGWK